jgi:hypothetical protein
MLVQKGTRTWAGELFIFKHSFCGIELVRKLQSMDHFGVSSPIRPQRDLAHVASE